MTADAPAASPPTTAPATEAPAAVEAPKTEPAVIEAPKTEADVRNLQDKFNGLLDQRNAFNDLARKAADERNQLNEQRREMAAGIDAHKTARDAANEEMRKHKELRNAFQDQAKALIAQKKGKAGGLERSLPLMVRKLRNDLQGKIELQQTTTLTVAKERVLVEEISAIWKELKEKEAELKKQQSVAVELSGQDSDIDALFAKADAEHEEVLKHQKVAQEHHEKFIHAVKETRVLVNEANTKHAEFVACKTKADEMHNKAMELREKVMSIRNDRKAQFDAQRQEVREVNQVARRNVADPKAIERHNDSLLEQMKKGGKISLGF